MTVESVTLPAESPAFVLAERQNGTVRLTLGIPRGIQGPTGAAGTVGAQGPQGIQGPPGPQGIHGVAVATTGTYAFNVNDDGDLILSYTGDTAPDFYINDNGQLMCRF